MQTFTFIGNLVWEQHWKQNGLTKQNVSRSESWLLVGTAQPMEDVRFDGEKKIVHRNDGRSKKVGSGDDDNDVNYNNERRK